MENVVFIEVCYNVDRSVVIGSHPFLKGFDTVSIRVLTASDDNVYRPTDFHPLIIQYLQKMLITVSFKKIIIRP